MISFLLITKARHRTERCVEKGEVEKVRMQWPEKPSSANDFNGHWPRQKTLAKVILNHFVSFPVTYGLFWLALGCSGSFWVVLLRFGSL